MNQITFPTFNFNNSLLTERMVLMSKPGSIGLISNSSPSKKIVRIFIVVFKLFWI